MTINFKDIPSGTGNFDSLPEDWYTIKVEKAELADSKNGPNTMIKVQFAIVSPAKYAKRKVWNNFNLGEKSLWVLKNFLDSAGKNTDTMGMIDESKLASDLLGLTVSAYLEPSTTQAGKPSNKISNYRKVGSEAQSTTVPVGQTSSNTMFQ